MLKLLWVGDDPRSKSGYGRVLKELYKHIKNTYDVHILSIGYKGLSNDYQIYDSSDGTAFGFNSVCQYINQLIPNVVILLNDHKIIWGWLQSIKENCISKDDS